MTEDMELSTTVSPIHIDEQVESVFYQRTFNLGNYENEKIGVVVKTQPGQTYEQVLSAAMDAVMKDHKEYDELREKIEEKRRKLWETEARESELKREIERLTEEKAALQAAVDGAKIEHPEIVQAIADAALKVGDRVALVGTLIQIDPEDKRAMYYVEWDGNGRVAQAWCSEKTPLKRITGAPAPESSADRDYDPEDEDYDFEDDDEDEEIDF